MFKFIFIFLFICNCLAAQQSGNMRLLANLNEHPGSGTAFYSALWGYKAPDGREYAILGCDSGTAFIDITDTNNIQEVGFLRAVVSDVREMKTYSHYAFIVNDITPGAGLQIVDLQYLPDSIHFVKNWNYPGYNTTHTISQSGSYLYLNGGNSSPGGGLTVIDITDPVNPVKRGSWTQKYVHDCRVRNDTVYAANILSNDGGTITVFNAANKDNLTVIGSWVNNPNPGPHNIDLTTDSKYALVTDEINGSPRVLKIWDIQSLSNPILISTWHPAGTNSIVHNIELYGNIAVIAHYTAGVRVVNISNRFSPSEIAFYDTYPNDNDFTFNGCWGVYMFPSGKIIASDRQTGLYVLKVTSSMTGAETIGSHIPGDFLLHQNYPNPFNPVTTIKYDLPENSYISLKIYDLNGKLQADVLSGYREAGSYSYVLNTSDFNLSSGIYYYILNTQKHSETKKFVLIK